MKERGIIRRMDDLGRVVIPSKIRQSLNLADDDRIEMFIESDGTIILKPYNPKTPIYSAIRQLREEVVNASIPEEAREAILKKIAAIRSTVENEC